MRFAGFVLVAGMLAMPAMAQSQNELAQVSQDWARNWRAKELFPTLSLYTDDAVVMDADGSRVSGKPALRQYFKLLLRHESAEPTLHSVSSGSSGDLGYDWGDYSETVRPIGDPRPPFETHGTYLVILRRVDGHWLIANQMWTASVPVPVKD